MTTQYVLDGAYELEVATERVPCEVSLQPFYDRVPSGSEPERRRSVVRQAAVALPYQMSAIVCTNAGSIGSGDVIVTMTTIIIGRQDHHRMLAAVGGCSIVETHATPSGAVAEMSTGSGAESVTGCRHRASCRARGSLPSGRPSSASTKASTAGSRGTITPMMRP